MSTTQTSDTTVMLDPGVILAEGNSRFGIATTAIESLADNILEVGRVLQNVEVEPLEKPEGGKKFRLNVGFCRHAAVTKLNTEQKAGLMLPAVIVPAGTAADRLKRQLSENLERRSLTPMDIAVAITEAMELGIPKLDVRKMFQTPGGRKGNKLQPLSNTSYHRYIHLLELPKPIQNKIHSGEIGVSGAFQLVTIMQQLKAKGLDPKEKLNETVADLEATRMKDLERDEKEEAKFLESQKKAEEAEVKAKEQAQQLEAAKAEIKAAEELVAKLEAESDAAVAAAKDAYAITVTAKKGDEAKAAKETHKAAEAKVKELTDALTEAKEKMAKTAKATGKLEEKLTKTSDVAKERAEKLKAAREASAKAAPAGSAPTANAAKKSGASAADVKKSAAKVGASSDHVPLKTGEFRKDLETLLLPSGMPKVTAIGQAILNHWNGVTTQAQLVKALAIITGESKASAAKG